MNFRDAATCNRGHFVKIGIFVAIVLFACLTVVIMPFTAHASNAVPVYRLLNPYDGQHLITADSNEHSALVNRGWNDEGVKFYCDYTSGQAIYRLYNGNNGDHLYSSNADEYGALQRQGWRGEGPQFYGVDASQGIPVYRLWNTRQTANGGLGSHLWTTDGNEYGALPGVSGGAWRQEGIAWYGLNGYGYSMQSMNVSLTMTQAADMWQTATWRYPSFSMTDLTTTPAMESINREIVAPLKRHDEENIPTNLFSGQQDHGIWINDNVKVTYLKDNITSVVEEYANCGVILRNAQEYIPGHRVYGQAGWEADGHIYDLSTGKRIDPWTYVNMSKSELLDQTRQAIRTYYAHREKFGYVTIESMLKGFDSYTGTADRNYYLCDEGLVYLGHMCEFFSRSEGSQYIVVVPFGDPNLFGKDLLE